MHRHQYQPDQPEHEEDEAADHHYAGEEALLVDQPEQEDDEDYGEGADDYVVGEVPDKTALAMENGDGRGEGGKGE